MKLSSEPSRQKRIALNVNDHDYEAVIPARTTLAELLRNELGLTGTKLGCNRAMCGSCTVIMEGMPVFACSVLAFEAAGKKVQTVEGLEKDGELHPIQRAFIEEDAVQCGICIPGMIMSAKALLDTNRSPTENEIRQAIAGNLCRCGTYPNTIRAVIAAAKQMVNQ